MAVGLSKKPVARRVIEAPFEMANLSPRRTGLDFVVWISNRAGARHDVRIKVSRKANEEPQAVFAVRPHLAHVAGDTSWLTPAQMQDLERWVAANREVLVAFWDSADWDHQDAIERLTRI